MNPNIEQLAIRAGMVLYPTGLGISENTIWGDRNIAHFAELIVRECLEACSRANEIRSFVPPTQEQVVLSCMREIETTFRS